MRFVRWMGLAGVVLVLAACGGAATAALAKAGGRLDSARTLRLLRRVRQPITRWSVAYDMRHRTLEVVMGQRYRRVLRFSV
jgi:hypothetical protein